MRNEVEPSVEACTLLVLFLYGFSKLWMLVDIYETYEMFERNLNNSKAQRRYAVDM